MKKFTKILICLMLCVFSFGFVACDRRSEKEKNFVWPSMAENVTGNGGLAVTKGNYVYFVNGFKSVSSLTNDNKKDTYVVGSLMLMRLDAEGNVVTGDNGLVRDEYYVTMSDKLCGYEATNLYVHGEYLYFVTPSAENEKGDKTWAKDRVVFNRVKLDKTSKVETVYESGVKYSNLEYEFYEEGSNLFILAYEKGASYYEDFGNNALVRVNATNKTHEVIETNVSSIAFAKNYNEICYVVDAGSKYLKKYNIMSNVKDDYTSFNHDVQLKFVAGGKVYILKPDDDLSGYTNLSSSIVEDKTGFEEVYTYEGSLTDTTRVFDISPEGAAVVVVKGNEISLIDANKKVSSIIDSTATEIKIAGYANGCIIYYETTESLTNIKMVSYSNKIAGSEVEIRTLTSVNEIDSANAYFDMGIDESYLYFFNKTGNNFYLNRIKVINNIEEKEEMFGVYLGGDVPVQEEVEEEIEE